jgi:hypothetical protein
LLQPYKKELLERVAHLKHWVVREHVCQLLPRLDPLTAAKRRRALALIQGYLADRSSIVRACAVECLVHLSAPAGFANERARARHHPGQRQRRPRRYAGTAGPGTEDAAPVDPRRE